MDSPPSSGQASSRMREPVPPNEENTEAWPLPATGLVEIQQRAQSLESQRPLSTTTPIPVVIEPEPGLVATDQRLSASQRARRLRRQRASSEASGRSADSSQGMLVSGEAIPLQHMTGRGEDLTDFELLEQLGNPRDDGDGRNESRSNGEGSSQQAANHAPVSSNYDGLYSVPPPPQYRGGVLSQLLKLYKTPQSDSSHHRLLRQSQPSTGVQTPAAESESEPEPDGRRRKWYEQNRSQDTLSNLIEVSNRLASPNLRHEDGGDGRKERRKRTKHKKARSRRASSIRRIRALWQDEETAIRVHIAETVSRHEFILTLCRCLMTFGAPTHRLEEILGLLAWRLEVEAQFLYLPDCMIVSFDDISTHTTEVKIVRVIQGINLGKLNDAHHIYKEAMHDVCGVDECTKRLEELSSARNKYSVWTQVLVYGLTSATCAPFSFQGRLIDLPIAFFLGCLVGVLQLVVAPLSSFYSNIFEVTVTVIISFVARAFGSINGGKLFCFSALAQSGIVMLLPGYAILCSALEMQTRTLVPGSVRLVYAVLYSLLLGFGITVGAALWGVIDRNATSDLTCDAPLDHYYGFIFVPPYIICISVLSQAKWRQIPFMIIVAFAGYIVSYFSGNRFSASPQISNALGALCLGFLANLHARVRHGVAAATLIPAIFVQVPDGLASTGGLLSGLDAANILVNNATQDAGSTASSASVGALGGAMFGVAASMIQIAIGIAVGLFISAVLIYPFGKRRSGLFSF